MGKKIKTVLFWLLKYLVILVVATITMAVLYFGLRLLAILGTKGSALMETFFTFVKGNPTFILVGALIVAVSTVITTNIANHISNKRRSNEVEAEEVGDDEE